MASMPRDQRVISSAYTVRTIAPRLSSSADGRSDLGHGTRLPTSRSRRLRCFVSVTSARPPQPSRRCLVPAGREARVRPDPRLPSGGCRGRLTGARCGVCSDRPAARSVPHRNGAEIGPALCQLRSRVALLLLASASGGVPLQEIAAFLESGDGSDHAQHRYHGRGRCSTSTDRHQHGDTDTTPMSAPTAPASAAAATTAPSAAPITDPTGAASAALQTGMGGARPDRSIAIRSAQARPDEGLVPCGHNELRGREAPYSCLAVFLDGGHHQVGLRIGRSGSENSAFGYLHALQDHNVEEQTIEHAVQINAAGVLQPNNRRLYGAEFVAKGKATEEFVAFEERAPSRLRRTSSTWGS